MLTTSQFDSFQGYRDDHHLTDDTMLVMTSSEMYAVLVTAWSMFPNAIAAALAVERPVTEDQWQLIEERLKGTMDADWGPE
jgi:hypothetical protein